MTGLTPWRVARTQPTRGTQTGTGETLGKRSVESVTRVSLLW